MNVRCICTSNSALKILGMHSLIHSRAQCEVIAGGGAALCHLQPISFVLNRSMRSLNENELVTSRVTAINKTQKILKLKDI